MDFDPTFLMLSLIPSGIGFVLFRYGRKAQRWPQLVTGLVLILISIALMFALDN